MLAKQLAPDELGNVVELSQQHQEKHQPRPAGARVPRQHQQEGHMTDTEHRDPDPQCSVPTARRKSRVSPMINMGNGSSSRNM